MTAHAFSQLVRVRHFAPPLEAAPSGLLLVDELAEIENGSLHRLVGSDGMLFYDAESGDDPTDFVRWMFAAMFGDHRRVFIRSGSPGQVLPLARMGPKREANTQGAS
jgi:hypothetical protein